MTVSESILKEAMVFGKSVALGFLLFLLYDMLRILRRIILHGAIWVAVEDIIYWLICTSAVFVMLYSVNDGNVRGYALGGVVVGMFFYHRQISSLVIRINVNVIRKALEVSKPFRMALKKISAFLGKQLKKVWKAFKIIVSKH